MDQFTGGARRETTLGHHVLGLRMALGPWVRMVLAVMGMAVFPATRTAPLMIDGEVAYKLDLMQQQDYEKIALVEMARQ